MVQISEQEVCITPEAHLTRFPRSQITMAVARSIDHTEIRIDRASMPITTLTWKTREQCSFTQSIDAFIVSRA